MLLLVAGIGGCEAPRVPIDPGSDAVGDTADPAAETVEELPDNAADDGCPTLYDQGRLPAFELELSDEALAGLAADYASGVKQYHPARFAYVDGDGGRVEIDDAAVRLKGNPGFSWIGEKWQFAVSFNEYDPDGRFLGLRKIALDTSWYDPSLLRDRLAYAYLRRRGVPAPCANNAELTINGEYYGIYANIEYPDQELLERLFGHEGATGTLWKYGNTPTVNEEASDGSAITAFWADGSVANQAATTDLPANIVEWSAEATLPQNDGYWCCNHNYYLYEHPTRGILFLPWDMDFSFDDTPYTAAPYTYYRDSAYQPHFDAVVADPTWGPVLVAEMRASVEAYDPDWMAANVREWHAQIADAVARDPHTPHTPGANADAADRLVTYVKNRHAWLDAWTTCQEGGGDGDGDGADACGDCDDHDATIAPGATESCNGRDDDCDGLVDEAATCETCEEYSFGDSRMLFCPAPRTWSEAQAVCEAQGATLGHPDDTYDWYVFWLHNYWQDLAWAGMFEWWTGATDVASEGTWLTPEGAPATWLGGVGGGANGGSAENCASVNASSWTWGDQACDARLPAICRVP